MMSREIETPEASLPSPSFAATGQRLMELLATFKTAMVVTREGKYLHSRPMVVMGVDPAGALYLGASADSLRACSDGLDDVFSDSVQVVCHSASVHVTVTGKASVISADQTKAVAPFANVELVVIKVEPTNGEFSDQARSSHATLWRPA